MTVDLKINYFGDRLICFSGIGKMFYQDGFPASMSVQYLLEKGIEVSILHVADECLKNGWSPDTTVKKLTEDFADIGQRFNKQELIIFCNSSYEDQREMIFNYLFNSVDDAKSWLTERMS